MLQLTFSFKKPTFYLIYDSFFSNNAHAKKDLKCCYPVEDLTLTIISLKKKKKKNQTWVDFTSS